MWVSSNPVLWNEQNIYIYIRYQLWVENAWHYMEMNAWHIVEIDSMLWCFVIFIFAHLLFCAEGNCTLEHLVRDEVAIARQVGSILIESFYFLMHYGMCWFMACESKKFDPNIKFCMHLYMVKYGGMILLLGIVSSHKSWALYIYVTTLNWV